MRELFWERYSLGELNKKEWEALCDNWLPETCAYRVVHRGEPLPKWHPLRTGNRNKMRKKGIKVSTYAVPAKQVPRRKKSQYIIARWQV
ncbi:hypothetical protein CWE15_11030 [Aliidiomarina taiwanensis]|uniref:Uncharacterized protein n=1 Tax=Aliidiomarina taiwanensis TaxID=946228 RepID=A0A432WVX2_9GAMM|nr:hypothetical protein [Aliidiomarina taiwanensis]RUO37887.1 hypothetical protein CWE15_11030 [Aliidiomarina taiwanensis]